MTATVTPEIRDAIAEALDEANKLWETGQAPSPDAHDYVLIAHRVLIAKMPDYHGSLLASALQEEKLSDALYEELTRGQMDSSEKIADWLIEELVG